MYAWTRDRTGLAASTPTALTLPAYLLLPAGLVLLPQARRGLERHAITDGVIV